jgi:hypothetical protein
MKQIAKSFLLNVPINIAYEAMKNLDTSRYTSDLIPKGGSYNQEVPNTLLISESRGSWGKSLRVEISFRKINDSSCDVTEIVEINNLDEGFFKLLLAGDIMAFMMLDYGYNAGKPKILEA